MFIKDFSTKAYDPYNHEGVKTISIGWLGNSVPSTGNVPSEFIDLLNHLYLRHSLSELEMGYHDCEICDNYYSYGIKPNRKTLELLFRYSREQGLCSRELTIEELFEPASLELTEG